MVISPCLALCVRAGDPNSNPSAWGANTLPTEPDPCPHKLSLEILEDIETIKTS